MHKQLKDTQLFFIQWAGTDGGSHTDFDWKWRHEFSNPQLIEDYFSGGATKFDNFYDYLRNPVFCVPNVSDLPLMAESVTNLCLEWQDNSCWSHCLVFALAHLAHSSKWLWVYVPLPDRALSQFWYFLRHTLVSAMQQPSHGTACLQQFRQSLAEHQLLKTKTNKPYTGREMIVLDQVFAL